MIWVADGDVTEACRRCSFLRVLAYDPRPVLRRGTHFEDWTDDSFEAEHRRHL